MDIKARMNQIETLSMFTLCESDQLSNELHSIDISNRKLNSMLSNGSSTEDHRQRCLDTNRSEQPIKSVTFASDIHHIPSISTYFSNIHGIQHRKMKNVENLFNTVGPILIKLESLVLDTSTGELNNMHLYYNFWENQLFELLIRYMIANLKYPMLESGTVFAWPSFTLCLLFFDFVLFIFYLSNYYLCSHNCYWSCYFFCSAALSTHSHHSNYLCIFWNYILHSMRMDLCMNPEPI